MREPSAEGIQLVLFAQMIGPLLALLGERLGRRVPFPPVGVALLHPLRRAGEIQIGQRKISAPALT